MEVRHSGLKSWSGGFGGAAHTYRSVAVVWCGSIVSARFEQHFIISGVGMVKGQELIALTTLEGSTGAKDQGAGGSGGRGGSPQLQASSPQTVPPATYVAPLSPQQQAPPVSAQPHQQQVHPVSSQPQSGDKTMSFLAEEKRS